MKKYFIMMAMLFTMVSGAFAEGNEATEVAEAQKYEFRINHRRLANALDMSKDQMEMSYDIVRELEQDMEFAKVIESKESRDAVVSNAVKKHIQWMRYTLTDKQYKRYLMLLNLTLEHRGFDILTIAK